jgi:hypothetical protein
MAALKTPEVAFHSLFDELECDTKELLHAVASFLDGDAGDFSDEDEILGFLDRDLNGKYRHGVYETDTAGRIHVTGDHKQLIVMPDIVFAQITKDSECSLNTCTCNKNPTQDTPCPQP